MKFKIGDIFEAYKNDGKRFFLQYLGDDDRCLKGNVIQVFDYEKDLTENIDIDELLKSQIKFNTHVYLKRGIEENIFKKIGNRSLSKKIKMPSFKHYEEDVDFMPEYKSGWYIWQVGGEEKYLGKIELPKKYAELSLDGVRPPETVVEWYETEEDPFDAVK